MKFLLYPLIATVIAGSVFAQENFEDACLSNFIVAPGSHVEVDCGIEMDGHQYQWTSQNPSWLAYLSDVKMASPRFRAPEHIATPFYLTYYRMAYDKQGDPVNQSTVSITVQQTAGTGNTDPGSITSEPEWMELNQVSPFEVKEQTLHNTLNPGGGGTELPFLQCASSITVESGELLEIPCTGLHQSGGHLKYHVTFDWPPYSVTEVLDEGEFVYVIRAPVIEEAASVHRLEVFAEEQGIGQMVSEQVEVHVVNRAPRLTCEDITVDEGAQVEVPCSISGEGEPKIQFLSELIPRGLYDDMPMVSIPEISQDTSIVMTVRAFGDGGSVAEKDFLMNVQPAQTPLNFDISCSGDPPLPYEEYEGIGPTEIQVSCMVVEGPKDQIVWVWGANGEDTPLELLDFQFTPAGQPLSAIITLRTEVNRDAEWEFLFDANSTDSEGNLNRDRELIEITILERPDLIVNCDNPSPVRTGAPPFSLQCIADTDLPHRDDPLTYELEWTSEDDVNLSLLEGDLNSGMPTFNVPNPEDLSESSATYTYMVTATAPSALNTTDPQENPTPVTVTVEKYFGTLALGCTSPIEIYAGDPDFSLPCSIGADDVQNLSYTWQLQVGPTDRLVEGESGMPPIFSVPRSVEDTETYIYEVNVEAPHYDPSNTKSVEIIVRARAVLSLDCQDDVTVRTGDPPEELTCSVSADPDQLSASLEYDWEWTSQDGGLPLLSGDPESAVRTFNVPADQEPPTVTYTYMINVSAPNTTPPQNSETIAVTVEKYPIVLDCPEEVVVMAGMPPERIVCTATTDEGVTLEYVWQWTPTERLSDTSTGSPLFDVPTRQRAYSSTYEYTVMVSAERAISAQTSVMVQVISTGEDRAEQVEVTVSELDFGVVGPQGQVMLDPATELISGLIYNDAQSHSGRFTIRARDSVLVSIEQLQSVVLRHTDTDGELRLIPQLADSQSCTTFSANTQISRILQISLSPEDCHVLRIGGEIMLERAEPGSYSGKIPVALTVNGLDQLHTIPVVLTVEAERRVVLLGPDGVELQAAPATDTSLDWQQRISIQPQVAVLGPQSRSGTFELINPSIYPMEVEVSTEFGYRETREQEPFSVGVTSQETVQGDLSEIITVYPKVVLLSPGESKSVHYGILDDIQLQDHGYAGRFNFTVTPREFINQSQSPISLNARITFQAPGIYTSGPATLQASIESMTNSAVVLLMETGSSPFYGEMMVLNDSGEELGRSEILIYTRSRVRVLLDSRPTDELTLRFSTFAPDQRSPSDITISSDL